jgi:hypothetical protein
MSDSIVQEMASILRAQNIDLGDERAVMMALTMNKFTSGDVVAYSDRAIEEARKGGLTLADVLGDSLGALAAIGAWLSIYCIICQPGSF